VKTLRLERAEDGVATLTLNRPDKKNAIDATMWAELLDVFREVGESTSDRVLVVTGAGDAFCSGADLGDDDGQAKHQLDRMHYFGQVALALHHVPKPVIAKVGGIAAGAGLNLALGCDLIVAGESARFSEIFARRGLAIDFGGSWLLPRLIGVHKAKELALLADIVSAPEAAEMGLVNRVVPDAELDGFVDGWARRLAAGPPLALKLTKRLLTDGLSSSLPQALEAEGMAQTVTVSSKDTQEAIRAFLEKREPTFQGR
jgi:2-(1,2-epoxy-1,2-dihydrophenyl)acetyl-CoA isomerase